jgi:hypothetical protein
MYYFPIFMLSSIESFVVKTKFLNFKRRSIKSNLYHEEFIGDEFVSFDDWNIYSYAQKNNLINDEIIKNWKYLNNNTFIPLDDETETSIPYSYSEKDYLYDNNPLIILENKTDSSIPYSYFENDYLYDEYPTNYVDAWQTLSSNEQIHLHTQMNNNKNFYFENDSQSKINQTNNYGISIFKKNPFSRKIYGIIKILRKFLRVGILSSVLFNFKKYLK